MTYNEKSSFVLYVNFGRQIRMLSMEERGELLTAIFEHEEHGHVMQPLSPRVELVYSFIEDALQRDRVAYEKRCEKNRENGKRGGRPKKGFEKSDRPFFDEKNERFSGEAKKADNENDNDNENENENDISLSRYGAEPLGAEPIGTPCPIAQKGVGILDDQEYLALIAEGMTGAFIRKKEERAKQYSIRHSISVANVLREWWRKESPSGGRSSSGAKTSVERTPVPGELGCSFDTDDFIQASVAYSKRVWGDA